MVKESRWKILLQVDIHKIIRNGILIVIKSCHIIKKHRLIRFVVVHDVF